ncbi:uncharacterized protein HHUB_1567 [Halobacterium hubeiense]|uniref:Uncharacterized protein n=1 Tax=Halobacterium hubeiense TaxID=1407499 RepID=A0A0U5H2V3_9EURY|nr:uncharacterized protein HHUB_1567 [Halobacterium hubeiense]
MGDAVEASDDHSHWNDPQTAPTGADDTARGRLGRRARTPKFTLYASILPLVIQE